MVSPNSQRTRKSIVTFRYCVVIRPSYVMHIAGLVSNKMGHGNTPVAPVRRFSDCICFHHVCVINITALLGTMVDGVKGGISERRMLLH